MQKICWEESFHIKHGYDIVVTMMSGTAQQKEIIQEALNRWWPPLVMFHGPPTDPAKDRDLFYRIKAKDNRTLRQEFFAKYIPKIYELGLTLPDPEVRFDQEMGEWKYSEPDWNELKMVVTGHGPRSQARLDLRRTNYANTQWVRDVILDRQPAAA